jgi:hypothetical protein
MLLGAVMVMLVMAAGVAVAVNKTCGDNLPCRGTDNDDNLHERVGSKKDRILGLDGSDLIDANNYGNDTDRLKGGPRGDKLLSNDNDRRDGANGGRGNDKCVVDRGDNTQSCSVNIQAAGVTPTGFEPAGTSEFTTD